MNWSTLNLPNDFFFQNVPKIRRRFLREILTKKKANEKRYTNFLHLAILLQYERTIFGTLENNTVNN